MLGARFGPVLTEISNKAGSQVSMSAFAHVLSFWRFFLACQADSQVVQWCAGFVSPRPTQ